MLDINKIIKYPLKNVQFCEDEHPKKQIEYIGLENEYKVYCLKEPNSELVRYIGITKDTLKKRGQRHLYDKRVNHRTCWIKKLKKLGQKPVIELIADGFNEEEALFMERQYIKLFKAMGADLVNSNDGGVLGTNLKGINKSPEHIAKIVATKRANGDYNMTEEHKKNISEAKKGKMPKNIKQFLGNRKNCIVSEETKKAISLKLTGRKDSEETKKNKSQGQIKRCIREGKNIRIKSNLNRSQAQKQRREKEKKHRIIIIKLKLSRSEAQIKRRRREKEEKNKIFI